MVKHWKRSINNLWQRDINIKHIKKAILQNRSHFQQVRKAGDAQEEYLDSFKLLCYYMKEIYWVNQHVMK